MSDDRLDSPKQSFVPLLERAAELGRWVWVERRIFEVFGGWAGSCGDDRLDCWFADMSRRHGRHSELLFDRMPELSVLDTDELIVAGGPRTEDWFAMFSDIDGIGRAAVAYRVLLPTLVVSYRSAKRTMSAVAEPSLIGSVGSILDDDVDEWVSGEEMVQSLVAAVVVGGDPSSPARDEVHGLQQALAIAVADTGSFTR